MKIEIPPFRANAICNEHLNHNGFSIDSGEDVVQVVRCRDCKKKRKEHGYLWCYKWDAQVDENAFCSEGKRKVEE